MVAMEFLAILVPAEVEVEVLAEQEAMPWFLRLRLQELEEPARHLQYLAHL